MIARVRIIVLSAVFVGLLGTYVVGSLSISRARRPAGAQAPVIETELLSETEEIRISRRGGQELQTLLRRGEHDDDRWQVRIEGGFYPADSRRVEGFLEVLGELRRLRVAGDDQQYHEEFDVSEDSARVVELRDDTGSPIERLLVGKVAAGGGRLYLRTGDADEVLVVQDDVGAYLRREIPYWSDLKPLPGDLEPQAIIRMSIDGDLRVDSETRIADRFTVFRDVVDGERAWAMDTATGNVGERLDTERVDAYAARLSRVEASAFVVDPPEQAGFDRPAVSIELETESGREYTVEVGDRAGESRFYMRVTGTGVETTDNGEPYLYTVEAEQLKPLLRNRDELMPEEE